MILSKFTVKRKLFPRQPEALRLASLSWWEVLTETPLVAVWRRVHGRLLLIILSKARCSFGVTQPEMTFGRRYNHLSLAPTIHLYFAVYQFCITCFIKSMFSNTDLYLSDSKVGCTQILVLLIYTLCLFLNNGLRSRVWKSFLLALLSPLCLISGLTGFHGNLS